MNTKISVLLGVVLFVAAGCNDPSQPRGVLDTAIHAIQDDRLEDFKATLSPELAQKIGNEPSLLKFRVALAGYQEIAFGDEIMTNEVQQQPQQSSGVALSSRLQRLTHREYSEQVLGRVGDSMFKLAYLATISCDTHAEKSQNTQDDLPPGTKEIQDCKLTQFE
jgi:hypothetical protein